MQKLLKNDYLTTEEVSTLLVCTSSCLYKWRTNFGHKNPHFIQLNGSNSRVLYCKTLLLEFIESCLEPSADRPTDLTELFPLVTSKEAASFLRIKVNTLHHNQDVLGIPYFRIHPSQTFEHKRQGLIRYSNWHLKRFMNVNSPYSTK